MEQLVGNNTGGWVRADQATAAAAAHIYSGVMIKGSVTPAHVLTASDRSLCRGVVNTGSCGYCHNLQVLKLLNNTTVQRYSAALRKSGEMPGPASPQAWSGSRDPHSFPLTASMLRSPFSAASTEEKLS